MAECLGCGGDGIYGDGESSSPCGVCRGTGEYEPNEPHTVVLAHVASTTSTLAAILLPTNVFYSHVIWEATDLTEFAALSDANKDAYRGIVRMGTVSLVDGSHSRNSLWDMFDTESTTRAALLALLT